MMANRNVQKGKKRAIAWLMAVTLLVSLLPVRAWAEEVIPVDVGKQVQLPDVETSDNGEEVWTVDDEEIASVSADGVVTGLQPGETVVRHTYYVEKAVPELPPVPEVPPTPETPQVPEEVPAVPGEIPETPETPETPENPEELPVENPETPENPEAPAENPETPEPSETPEAPAETPTETPDASDGKASQETDGQESTEEPGDSSQKDSQEETGSAGSEGTETAGQEETTGDAKESGESGSDQGTDTSADSGTDASEDAKDSSSDAGSDSSTGSDSTDASDSSGDSSASDSSSDSDTSGGDSNDASDTGSDASDSDSASDGSDSQSDSASFSYNDANNDGSEAGGETLEEITYVPHIQSWKISVQDTGVKVVLEENAVYNGIRVDVTAYSDSFETVPAQVKILPVVQETEQSEVEDAAAATAEEVQTLLEEQAEKPTQVVAAFDITFLNEDGEELQPTGTVDVTFSMEDADTPEDAELRVYHVDADLTEATEVEASEQNADSITVEADSFSIYALTQKRTQQENTAVKTLSIQEGETVTLNCENETVYKEYGIVKNGAREWVTANRWLVDKDQENGISVQQDQANLNQVKVTGEEAGKVTLTHAVAGWVEGADGKEREQEHTEVYEITVLPKNVYLEDTILTNGSLTAMADNKQLDKDAYRFEWYVDNDVQVTTDAKDKEKSNYFGYYVDDDGTVHQNMLFVARGGAQRTFYVKVYDKNTDKLVATSATKKVDYYDELQNGSFEEPDNLSSYYYISFADCYQVPVNTPGLYWKTTGLGGKSMKGRDIEIIKAGDASEGTYGIRTAQKGARFAELNCENWGALYQDVLTVPGSMIHWQVYHAARFNPGDEEGDVSQTMYIVVANANDDDIKGWEKGNINFDVIKEKSMTSVTSTKKGVWTERKGDYKVPDGQYVTRFYFASNPKNPINGTTETMGNLIDDVWFSTDYPTPPTGKGNLALEKKLDGVPAGTKIPADAFTFAVKDNSGKIVNTVFLPTSETTYDGDSLSDLFTGLEPGQYTVTETVNRSGETLGSVYQYVGENGKAETASVVSGETKTVSFTNAYQFQSPTTDVTVTKDWAGENNTQDRPETVTVALYQCTTDTEPYDTVELNDSNRWTYTFKGLPLYDSAEDYNDKKPAHHYTVKETKMGKWEVDQETNRVIFGKDGKPVKTENGTIAETKEVRYVWASTVQEKDSGQNVTIINTRYDAENVPEGELKILKKTSDKEDGYPIEGVGFTLYRNGEETGSTLYTGKDGTLTYSNLEDGEYTLKETYTPSNYQGTQEALTIKISKGKVLRVEEKTTEDGEGTNIFQNFWEWIVGVVSGGKYEQNDGYLLITNAPLAIGITKQVWDGSYTLENCQPKLGEGGSWADTATFSGLPADQKSVKVLFKVTVTGAYKAPYEVTDTMNGTELEPLSGAATGTLDTKTATGGQAELYYEATIPLSATAATYTNTAALKNNSEEPEKKDIASVTVSRQEEQKPTIGSLTIEKRVYIDKWENIPDDYTATISYGDEQTVTFGKGDFSQNSTSNSTADEVYYTASRTLEKVQPGVYTIRETDSTDVKGYMLTASEPQEVTVIAGEEAAATVKNFYQAETPIPPTTGTLSIEKRVYINDWAAVPSNYTVTVSYNDQQVTFEKSDFTQDGTYYTVSRMIENVKPGTYAVQENAQSVNGYTLSASYDSQAEVKAGGVTDVTVVNQYNPVSVDPNPNPNPNPGPSGGGGDSDDDPPMIPIPDDRTPTTELPDADVPKTDLPDVPDVDLPDEDVPLAELPDEDVPKDEYAEPTKTGDDLKAWIFVAAASGLSLVWLALSGKKKHRDGEV